MKRIKKMMALALAMAMVLGMTSMAAFAADPTYSISMTIAAGDKHEYKVYQIYTGDLSDGTLSNVKYGNSGYGTAGATVSASELSGITDADAFARNIASQCTTTVGVLKDGTTSITGLAPGYYLIVDDTEKTLVEGDAYSAYIVEVVQDATVSPKKSTTSVDKTITTDTLGKDDATTKVNGKVDDVSIGDVVNYKIEGTIPSHATDYDYYFYIIGDTLTDGLTFNNDVKVYSGYVYDADKSAEENAEANESKLLTVNEDYALYTTPNADGKTFQVAMLDAIDHAGETITVVYSATLNENAKIGENSNDNTVTIEYSNNPNHDYDGDKDDDTPGKPDSEKTVPTGTTPESKTTTYTTGIEITKVDQDGKVLTGAEFTITGDNAEIVLVSSETFAEDAEGTYYKLSNGTYTTEAPVTEQTMREAATGATAGYVVDATYEGDDAITVGGIKYRPYNAETDTEATVYILVEPNADQYDSTTKMYKKTVTYEQKNTNTAGVTATAEVGPDGKVIFNGLGAGTYTISETKTPAGYNTVADMSVTIAFTANPETGEVHWSKTSGDATYNSTTGEFEITVVNNKGSELPETGGIGTTIFYVVGAILVIGAGVIMITRRRMDS